MSAPDRRRSSAGYAVSPTGTVRRTQKAGAQGAQRVSGFVVLTFILVSTLISLYDLRLLFLLLGR